jgi:hypothetical protein
MLTATERRDLMAKMRRLPAAVEAAAKDLTDAQLNTPYREGGWTVRQVVHHLADSHLNGFVRMKLMLTEAGPVLKPRSALHPEVGVVTLADFLADYARHGEQHVEQVMKLRAAQGW